MSTQHRLVIFTAVTGLLMAATVRGQQGLIEEVRVEKSDRSELVLELTPKIVPGQLPTGELMPRIGSAIIDNADQPGAPMHLSIAIPVALPSAVGNSLQIISAQYGDPQPGRIAPVPDMEPDAAGMYSPVYQVDEIAYARAQTPPVAELRYKGIARELHAGSINISPCQFDARTKTVRFLRSVRVRLRYGAATTTTSTAGNAVPFASRVFINGDAASAWAIPVQNTRGFQRRSAAASAKSWMRVEVKQDGLYVLTAEDFRNGGIDLATVDPDRITIYGGNGGILDERNLMLDSAMPRVPVMVEREGGRAARIYFFGAGPYTWTTQQGDVLPRHQINPYVNSSSYIVAVDGEPALSFPSGGTSGTPSITLNTGIARLFHEEDVLNALDVGKQGGSGRDWFGMQFQVDASRPTDTRVFSMKLPGLVRSDAVTYRVRCANSGKKSSSSFQIGEHDNVLGDLSVRVASGKHTFAMAGDIKLTGPGSAIDGDNTSMLKITHASTAPASGFLDWYEVHYTRTLTADADVLAFDAPAGEGLAFFSTSGFSTGDLLGFDVTDRARPSRLDLRVDGGNASFTDALNPAGKSRRYLIAAKNAAQRVSNVVKVGFGDLRNRALNAEILVITHPDLSDAARAYCEYRNGQGRNAVWVTTEEIYTEFSSGSLDPTAIRNFIGHVYHLSSRRSTHVLLIGDGHYDYRNILFKQKQLIPPYQTVDGDIYDHVNSSCVEDYFVRMTTNAAGTFDMLADIAIGRLPVETLEQAQAVLAKIKRYEQPGNFGLWRTTIGFSADDDDPYDEGSGFTGHSESACEVVPSWLEPKKIYLAAYSIDQSNVRRSPIAESDLARTIEQGAVILNWVGHGNPNVWAHESLLEKDKFIPQLRNDSMLTYIPAVTCNFGYFDDPAVLSGGEMFVLHPHGGAIGVMTATRAVLIPDNSTLMRQHLSVLFQRDPATRRFASLGEILLATKYVSGAAFANDEKYMLLGDPVLRLNLPQDSVHIASINTTNVDTDVAVVGALTQVTIQGEVMDNAGAVRADFNGRVIISLHDADRPAKIETKTRSGEPIYTYNVAYQGGRLFRGSANVQNGRFSITFRVPKDIAYDSSKGRVYAYAYSDREDAAGITDKVIVYGADNSPITDQDGPEIKLFVDDRSFRSGDMVTPEPMLIVDLADPSGINSSGSSIGHRIEAWVDGSAESVDLTETYQTEPTDYGKGSAQRELLSLEPGEHHVRVRAWDIYNNVSEGSTYFRIAAGDAETMQITEVVNYPNPMTHETDFLFRHNQVRPLDVEVDIFTTSGRKLRELDARGVTDRFVRVHWDGTDSDGRRLANGAYLYRIRVRVTGEEAGEVYEAIQTVAIVR